MAAPLITLTTDFGTRDPYVAQLKGVLASLVPDATVTDLSHDVAPQDILEASFFLAATLAFFPPATIHFVVVDPGVGSGRRPLAVAIADQFVVCPDNGLLTLAVRRHGIDEARIIEAPDFQRFERSHTFHARDVFAPAAARLASGAPLTAAGPVATDLVQLDIPEAAIGPGAIHGEVLRVDRFGNAITNIDGAALGEFDVARVTFGAAVVEGLHATYADVPPGAPLALIGSHGYLEIACHAASAADRFRLTRGTPVEVVLA
jgi:hypothetical protein